MSEFDIDAAVGYYTGLLDRWDWLSGSGFCLTVIDGISPEEALRRMGGDVEAIAPRTVEEVLELQDCEHPSGEMECPAVAAAFGSATVVLEPNGFEGTRPEVARALSANSWCISIYWNCELDNSVEYTRNGELWWSFDAMFYPDSIFADLSGSHPEDAARATAGLPFGSNPGEWRWGTAMLALIERETGFRLNDDWLSSKHASVMLKPLPDDIVAPKHANHPALAEPEIAEIFSAPELADPAWVALLVAERAARVARLNNPVVNTVLRELRARRTPTPEILSVLREREQELQTASSAIVEQRKLDKLPESVWSSPEWSTYYQAIAMKVVAEVADGSPTTGCVKALGLLGLQDESNSHDLFAIHVLYNCHRAAIAHRAKHT